MKSQLPPSSLDSARSENPELGFALYAFEAGKPITLEVHTPLGKVYTFTGVSETAVLAKAFPPPPAAPPPPPPKPEPTVFD